MVPRIAHALALTLRTARTDTGVWLAGFVAFVPSMIATYIPFSFPQGLAVFVLLALSWIGAAALPFAVRTRSRLGMLAAKQLWEATRPSLMRVLGAYLVFSITVSVIVLCVLVFLLAAGQGRVPSALSPIAMFVVLPLLAAALSLAVAATTLGKVNGLAAMALAVALTLNEILSILPIVSGFTLARTAMQAVFLMVDGSGARVPYALAFPSLPGLLPFEPRHLALSGVYVLGLFLLYVFEAIALVHIYISGTERIRYPWIQGDSAA